MIASGIRVPDNFVFPRLSEVFFLFLPLLSFVSLLIFLLMSLYY